MACLYLALNAVGSAMLGVANMVYGALLSVASSLLWAALSAYPAATVV